MTQEQKELALKLLNEGMIRKDVAKAIHTRYYNLKAFLDKQGVKKKKYGIPWEYYEPIFDLYNRGMTLQQIHDNYYPQFTVDQINYICRCSGITRPNGKQAILNHHYFSQIDSNEKAYWLGLLAADGNVQIKEGRYTVSIGLRAQENYLIEEFAKAVETDKTVKEYINSSGFQRKDGQPHRTCRIVLHSKIMVEDLMSHGIVPRKSLIYNQMPNIEDRYMSHFIRGFFD